MSGFDKCQNWLWGHTDFYTLGPRAVSPGVKQQRYEAFHSPTFVVEVKNDRTVSPPPYTSSWYDD